MPRDAPPLSPSTLDVSSSSGPASGVSAVPAARRRVAAAASVNDPKADHFDIDDKDSSSEVMSAEGSYSRSASYRPPPATTLSSSQSGRGREKGSSSGSAASAVDPPAEGGKSCEAKNHDGCRLTKRRIA